MGAVLPHLGAYARKRIARSINKLVLRRFMSSGLVLKQLRRETSEESAGSCRKGLRDGWRR